MQAASEALTDMPPRLEEELDPVTLHNQALISMDTKPTEGYFLKLLLCWQFHITNTESCMIVISALLIQSSSEHK